MAESKEQDEVVELDEKEVSASEAEDVKGGMSATDPTPKLTLKPADSRLIIPCI